MARLLFRVLYGGLLAAVFLGAVWFGFRRAIVGRSVTVPDLAGKTPEDAIGIVRAVGLKFEEQETRARHDDRIPAGRVLIQQPEAGALAKPAQVVRVVLSLGPRELRVPDLSGLAPRAASLKLARESLELGPASWLREPAAPAGIVAQDPEPDTPASRGETVRVLTNRGAPETRIVMPDLVGKDAESAKARLEKFGFKVGSARLEAYEGVRPNTILKQFPPAGYPLSSREVVSLTVSRPPASPAAPRS